MVNCLFYYYYYLHEGNEHNMYNVITESQWKFIDDNEHFYTIFVADYVLKSTVLFKNAFYDHNNIHHYFTVFL